MLKFANSHTCCCCCLGVFLWRSKSFPEMSEISPWNLSVLENMKKYWEEQSCLTTDDHLRCCGASQPLNIWLIMTAADFPGLISSTCSSEEDHYGIPGSSGWTAVTKVTRRRPSAAAHLIINCSATDCEHTEQSCPRSPQTGSCICSRSKRQTRKTSIWGGARKAREGSKYTQMWEKAFNLKASMLKHP